MSQIPKRDERQVNYTPGGPIIRAFHNSDAFVRGIMGPIGSSKSSACCVEILRRAGMQAKSPDGLRRSRFAIIRNSYPELKTTTLKTWADWCPLAYGKLTQDSPITHYIKTPELDLEVLFMALDREEDAKKLLSLELTGAWLNEAREIPKGILDALTGRVGRYPSKSMGGATWSGIIMDTNPPDDQSWWYKCAEERTGLDPGWEFFHQPAGDGSHGVPGENVQNLPTNYYERIKAGKDDDWVKVYVRGEYGFVTEGKAVFPMYRDRIHTAPQIIEPLPNIALSIGGDFGLTPAAVIGQKLPDGRWFILDEVTTDNCGVIRFAELLAKYVRTNYPNHIVGEAWGDPAGNQRAFSDERSAMEIMKEYTGWNWKPAPSNDPLIRREVVIGALNRMVDGNPGILVSPKCRMVRKGFTGGYHYRSFKTGNQTQFHEEPFKNEFSHAHDALQYLFLGGGEHNVIMNRERRKSGRRRDGGGYFAKDLNYDVFGLD